jgi:predicted acylesterase/phospholipase RssA
VLDNLPVEDMALAHEGPVIAVDVSARRHPPALMDPPGRARGPRPDALPSLRETLNRTMLLGSTDTAETAREHSQLVILPEDRGVGFLEFHQYDTLRDAGREAARTALELPGVAALLRI